LFSYLEIPDFGSYILAPLLAFNLDGEIEGEGSGGDYFYINFMPLHLLAN
jgi:hypothetical protein